MKQEDDRRIQLETLDHYFKLDRKQYEIAGYNLPSPLSFRQLGYYFFFFAIFLGISFLPFMPSFKIGFVFYVAIPGLITYGLYEAKTDGKGLKGFFVSYIGYQTRKLLTRKTRTHRLMRTRKPRVIVFDSPIFIRYSSYQPMEGETRDEDHEAVSSETL